jgi:hypothetical protein
MVIAIDETGGFDPSATTLNYFIAVHIRQRKTIYKLKQRLFEEWENSLPRSLKNSKGEIKSASLSDDQLKDLAINVICPHYRVGITPYAVRPSDNPEPLVEKYRAVNVIGIDEGAKEYAAMGKERMAKFYIDFGYWLKKLNYAQYLKLLILGECIAAAMVNTVGHAISGRYDEELTRMRFLIDRDFIKEPHSIRFWREILRNQLYNHSRMNPVPVLRKWKAKGHPFLEKYTRNGHLDFNELFTQHCSFGSSHECFEIRIADAINTIAHRFTNKRECKAAYTLIRSCFLMDGKIHGLVLRDFDLEQWRYNPEDNPWRKMPNSALALTAEEPESNLVKGAMGKESV